MSNIQQRMLLEILCTVIGMCLLGTSGCEDSKREDIDTHMEVTELINQFDHYPKIKDIFRNCTQNRGGMVVREKGGQIRPKGNTIRVAVWGISDKKITLLKKRTGEIIEAHDIETDVLIKVYSQVKVARSEGNAGPGYIFSEEKLEKTIELK